MMRFPFCSTRISKVGKCAALKLWTPMYFTITSINALHWLNLLQLWNFVGFVLYTGTGVISAITWTNAKNMDDDLGDKARNYDAALTMSAFCILQGLIYFVDFIFAKRARNRILEDGY